MDIRRFFLRYWPIILGVSIFVYFGYHGFSGERGIFSYRSIQTHLDEKEFELLELRSQRNAIEKKVKRLNPHSVDLDFLEEQAMRELNFYHPSHFVIMDKASNN